MQIPSIVSPLLQQYGFLFQEHRTLHAIRSNNHKIHLSPRAGPVNIPYIPLFAKQEVGRLYNEMLVDGLIRNSTTASSSHF